MSFIDEIKNDPVAWLARARAEPEDALPDARLLSLSLEDIESLEQVVSGKSPRYEGPMISSGAASLGGTDPVIGQQERQGSTRAVGGRRGLVTNVREPDAARAVRRT